MPVVRGDTALVSTPQQRQPAQPIVFPNQSPANSAAARAAAGDYGSIPNQQDLHNMPQSQGVAGWSHPTAPMSNNSNGHRTVTGDGTDMTWVALLVLVIAIVAVTISITAVASRQSPDVSSHMIVRTGHRTRDWSSGNSYSMHSLDDNHLTRLYVCMKSSGIAVPNDPNIGNFMEFRTAAKNYHDCGLKSDRGWPRDVGFLRCIQKNFGVNFHKSNVFLKCLDLSEGSSAESIQTPASMLFLGSYNFVTMLLTCMGIITAFLIFTAGGYFTSAGLEDFYGHMSATHYWSPLSWVPTILALLWSFSMWVTVMIYSFPPSNLWSDAPNDSGASLPGTPWTGFMCSVVVFALFVFFVSCVGEWMDDYSIKRDGYSKKFDSPTPYDDASSSRSNNMMGGPEHDSNTVMTNSASTASGAGGARPDQPGSWQNHTGVAGRFIRASPLNNLIRRYAHNRTGRPARLGAKYNHDLHCTVSDLTRIASPLNKTFALTWVFVDGLMFVGMLNNQNSLLNENVVAIWYYVTLCRGYQLTATFFMDDVLFVNTEPSSSGADAQGLSAGESQSAEIKKFNSDSAKTGNNDASKNSEIKAHAGVAVVCTQIASFWCMVIVAYHFSNAISVIFNLNNIGVSTSIHVLQIFFILTMLVIELFKHVVAFAAVFNQFSQEWYLYIIQGTYSVDWVVRSIFIIATIFSVPNLLSDANQGLRSTIMLPTT